MAKKILISLFLLAGLIVGQRSSADSISEFSVAKSDARWEQINISVCWENPSSQDANDRRIVQEAVANTWQRHSPLHFTGWEKCSVANAGDIRILISDQNPLTNGLGRFLKGRKDGMVLNFAFKKWCPVCAVFREINIYAIAVHEFGHAIGLTHEQNRPDADKNCTEPKQGTSGDMLLGPYDPNSVMNYCSVDYGNSGCLTVPSRHIASTPAVCHCSSQGLRFVI